MAGDEGSELAPPTPHPDPRPVPFGPELVERFMSISGNFGKESFLDKLDTDQVSKMLDQVDDESKRSHERNVLSMRYAFWIVVVLALMVLALCWIFLSFQSGDLLREIIILLVGLGGGGTAGFGAGRLTAPKSG